MNIKHWLRRLRHVVCRLTGGHQHMWPIAHADALLCSCSRCGLVSVIDLSQMAKPVPYHGVAKSRRVSG